MSLDALKIEVLKLRKLQRLELMTFLLECIAEEEEKQEALFELTERQQQEVMRRREDLVGVGTVHSVFSASSTFQYNV